MDDQGDLFSAKAAKQDGMERVGKHADEAWLRAAGMAAFQAAKELAELTSDDVWDRIPPGFSTHEYRAMGPVMQTAAKSGWIIQADKKPRPSKRRSLHASPRTVWRSLLH
jgi:hypothetical protein